MADATLHRHPCRSCFTVCKPVGAIPSDLLKGSTTMIQQLRIYEIFENNKAAFHARFRDHAARIMRTRYGFQIVAMWETRFGDRTEFAYLLEWPDEAAKTAAWAAFMADQEWSDIKRATHAEHGLMVGQIEDRLLVPTDYSAAKGRSLLPDLERNP
jgi:NIPSNAP